MPLVEVSLAEGRTPDQIRRLLRDVHSAVVQALGSPDSDVRVIVREVPKTHWSAGGRTLVERDGPSTTEPAAQSPALHQQP